MRIKLRGKAKAFEQKAQQIRKFAGARANHRFDVLALAKQLKLVVIADAHQLRQHLTLEPQTAEQLFLHGSMDWSGGATHERPDGTRMVILNPTHSPQRQTATLMEEICHILLGHKPSSITPDGQQLRNYHQHIEEEAYGVGAAVLLPCADLMRHLEEGCSEKRIADYFGVSISLVRFRRRFLEIDIFRSSEENS